LVLRLVLQFGPGYYGDPWSYRFFPSEIAVFLVGALAYRVFRARNPRVDRMLPVTFAVSLACVGAALLVNRGHCVTRGGSVCCLRTCFALLPFLFRTTKNWLFDRHLGELSYPIYTSHFLVIWLLDSVGIFGTGAFRGAAILAGTVAASCALYWWVDRPVDGWR